MSEKVRYFNRNEFACKCGCGGNKISQTLINLLEECRQDAGVPFIITSGYRCEKHNKNVGGVAFSSHISGLAVDISLPDETKDKIIRSLQKIFVRNGVNYKKRFIHVDIDSSKSQKSWIY